MGEVREGWCLLNGKRRRVRNDIVAHKTWGPADQNATRYLGSRFLGFCARPGCRYLFFNGNDEVRARRMVFLCTRQSTSQSWIRYLIRQ